MSVPGRQPDHDGDLVGAVQGGDLDAFAELFRRHYRSVHRACTRRLGDAVEADEVAQATFVRALERIDQCRGERRFGPWVQVIARHLCLDHRRAWARVLITDSPLSDDHSDGTRPEDPLLELEQRDQVRRAIADLPERQRRAVTARALGLRPGEIAATLGLSIGAVDSLLLRARRRLALTYTSMASESGAAAATTGTSATASLGGALAVDHAQVADGLAAAASQVASAVGSVPGVRPAGGLVSAVVGAALALGGSGQPAPPVVVPPPPPAASDVGPVPEVAPSVAGSPQVVVDHQSTGPGGVTVTIPATVAGAPVPSVSRGDEEPGAAAPVPAGADTRPAPEPASPATGGALPDVSASVPHVPAVPDVTPALPDPAAALPVAPPAVPPIELPRLEPDSAPPATLAGVVEAPAVGLRST